MLYFVRSISWSTKTQETFSSSRRFLPYLGIVWCNLHTNVLVVSFHSKNDFAYSACDLNCLIVLVSLMTYNKRDKGMHKRDKETLLFSLLLYLLSLLLLSTLLLFSLFSFFFLQLIFSCRHIYKPIKHAWRILTYFCLSHFLNFSHTAKSVFLQSSQSKRHWTYSFSVLYRCYYYRKDTLR